MSSFFGGAYADARPWDEVWLAGAKMPGIATVEGDGIRRKLDIKSQKGSAGATITDNGDEPGRGKIQIEIWTEAQWMELQQYLPTLSPRKRGGTKSVTDVYHPLLELLGISRIYITDVVIPKHDKRQGRLKVVFSFLEWFPAPKPQPPPKTKGTGGSGAWKAAQEAKAAQQARDERAVVEGRGRREDFFDDGPTGDDGDYEPSDFDGSSPRRENEAFF